MAVTVERSAADARTRIAPVAPAATLGRRSGRRVAAGVLLVLAAVVTFWQVDLRRHAAESFLAVARPVAAGQVLGEADVRVVRVANASGLALVGADRRAEVVGRTAAVPLSEGSLLTAAQLGPVAWPPAGQAVIAVAVKPGRGPAGLAAGARVVVLVVPTGAGGPAAPQPGGDAGVRRAVASVVSVAAGVDQVGTLLVTLLLPAEQAEMIASAAGDVALVQLGPRG